MSQGPFRSRCRFSCLDLVSRHDVVLAMSMRVFQSTRDKRFRH